MTRETWTQAESSLVFLVVSCLLANWLYAWRVLLSCSTPAQIVKGLRKALDDRKRSVRQLAAATRNKWCLMNVAA